jgi:hypothetical protein
MQSIHDIILIDHFLNSSEVDQLNTMLADVTWRFGRSTYKEYNLFDTPFWDKELKNNEYFSVYLRDKILGVLNKQLRLTRVYINGITYSQDAIWHNDDDNDKCFTFCLYINKNDRQNIGGNIDFKFNNKFIYSFETINNRALFFPATIFHKGNSYNRFVSDLRICITWKFILEK